MSVKNKVKLTNKPQKITVTDGSGNQHELGSGESKKFGDPPADLGPVSHAIALGEHSLESERQLSNSKEMETMAFDRAITESKEIESILAGSGLTVPEYHQKYKDLGGVGVLTGRESKEVLDKELKIMEEINAWIQVHKNKLNR